LTRRVTPGPLCGRLGSLLLFACDLDSTWRGDGGRRKGATVVPRACNHLSLDTVAWDLRARTGLRSFSQRWGISRDECAPPHGWREPL